MRTGAYIASFALAAGILYLAIGSRATARISRSGQATPAAGDLYVTSEVLRPAAGTRLALVINWEIG